MKLQSFRVVGIALALFAALSPLAASAAFIATEDFESYVTYPTNYFGVNAFGAPGWGGSNWTTDWSVTNNSLMHAEYSAGLSSVALISTDVATATRSFFPISSGILHFSFTMSDGTIGHQVYILLGDSLNTGSAANTNRMGISLNASSENSINATDGQGSYSQINPNNIDLSSYPIGIDIKFDKSLGNFFQVSIDGSPYSSNIPAGGDISHIDQIVIADADPQPGHFFRLDNIRPGGNINMLSKFIGPLSFGDSLLSDDGSNVTLTKGGFFIPANGLGIDLSTAGTLSIGSTTASAIKIGKLNATTTVVGPLVGNVATVNQLKAGSECNSSASPAACGSAMVGGVALPTGGSTLVVNNTAVTAASHIFITEDPSLASRLGIACNTNTSRNYSVSARTPGTSFTIKSSANPTGTKACLSYLIVN